MNRLLGIKMKNNVSGISAMVILCLCLSTISFSEELQLVAEKVSENVLMVTTKTSNSTMLAVAGDKGILVVDAMWAPGSAKKAKEVIAKEFGRNDFKYLIMANFGDLSCGGLSAFSECEIISHERAKAALERYANIKERSWLAAQESFGAEWSEPETRSRMLKKALTGNRV